ncbi:hypothetical protein FKP32DRAFT_1672806, partial [Trametes sanguinea]
MDATTEKAPYAPIEQPSEADAPPPRVQRQSSRQIIRRKVSRAFTSLTRRYSSTSTAASESTEDGDDSQPASPAVSPPASRTSTTQFTTIVERERADMSYYSSTYPL